MTKETIKGLKQKIHWFILPILISLLTWIVVMIYSISASVQVIQNVNENNKEQYQNSVYMQNRILNTSEEARSFSVQNNNILTEKADRDDVLNIQQRLLIIEKKVDKIYNRNNWASNNDTIFTPSSTPSFTPSFQTQL